MPSSCNDLFKMKNGETCTDSWQRVREYLHPAQSSVGFAAVKRKYERGYRTEDQAQRKMTAPLPFVLGPRGVPYLIDSHHTASALEASGHDHVRVTLEKVCDWSDMSLSAFTEHMQRENLMIGDMEEIPATIGELGDNPWRSLAALVRKVKNKKECPPDHPHCLRGYVRECQSNDGAGMMIPFFEFRWAYFMEQAYRTGCENKDTCFWDNVSDCQKFHTLYEELTRTTPTKESCPSNTAILESNSKAWRQAAALLVPLCRSQKAQTYQLPTTLGPPLGGELLPGRVAGINTPILREDPECTSPTCPSLPPKYLPSSYLSGLFGDKNDKC